MIDWSTELLNSGYKLREMRREGGSMRMKTVHSGGGERVWRGGGGISLR